MADLTEISTLGIKSSDEAIAVLIPGMVKLGKVDLGPGDLLMLGEFGIVVCDRRFKIVRKLVTITRKAATMASARLFGSLRTMTILVTLSARVSRNDFWSLAKIISILKWPTVVRSALRRNSRLMVERGSATLCQ
ncbi:TPA: hypothetical protein ACPZHQ_003855 [Yersinia enterocolitica]